MSDEHVSRVLGLYDVGGLGRTLEANSFDQEELVDTMVRHVRSPDPKVSQAGINQLMGYTEKLVKANGLIGEQHIQGNVTDGEGNQLRITATNQRVLSNISKPLGKLPEGVYHEPGLNQPPEHSTQNTSDEQTSD